MSEIQTTPTPTPIPTIEPITVDLPDTEIARLKELGCLGVCRFSKHIDLRYLSNTATGAGMTLSYSYFYISRLSIREGIFLR